MVKKFIDNCKDNFNIAFIYKNKKITYNKLYEDIFKMISLFKEYNLKPNDKVLLFIIPSYNFYLVMLASIYYGLNIIVIDSFKDKNKVNKQIDSVNVNMCFVDDKTNVIKGILPKLKFINLSKYYKKDSIFINYVNYENIVLTTFTSGTTSIPKVINRSIIDLEKQVNLLTHNIDFYDSKIVLCGLPIYMLLLLTLGKTCVIDNKLSNIYYDTVLMPIEKILKNKKINNNVKYMFLGGAILYKKEVEKIKYLYPNAYVNYVYGSSEGLLIARTDLKDYNDLTFNKFIKGIDVSIVDNEIMISGDCLLTPNKTHLTGDLGVINDGCLKILGRKKYSNNEYYNYVFDELILNENPYVKKGFSFWYNDNICFVYEGKLSVKEDNVKYYRFRKLPMDSKHKTKLDYISVMKVIK